MKRLQHISFSITMFLLAAGVLTGCSPKVSADMFTYEFAPVKTSKVMLLTSADSVPGHSISIGRLESASIYVDSETAYKKLIDAAVKETAQNGGNVLVLNNDLIENKLMNGNIMHTDTAVVESLAYSPQRVQQLWQKQQDTGHPQETTTTTAIVTPKTKPSLGGILKLSAGPLITTSKIYTSVDGNDYVTGQRGFAVDCSLTGFGKNGHGPGADLFFSKTSVDAQKNMMTNIDNSYTLFYIGPHYAAGARLGSRLHCDANIGIGLAVYTDNEKVEAGLGMRFCGNIEYLVTNTVGIGVEVMSSTNFFKRPENFNQPKGETYGIQHLGVLFGLRFHF